MHYALIIKNMIQKFLLTLDALLRVWIFMSHGLSYI